MVFIVKLAKIKALYIFVIHSLFSTILTLVDCFSDQ